MRLLALVPFLFALADTATCTPAPLPVSNGGSTGYQEKCTPPAVPYTCTVHYYNGCGLLCGNQPVTVSDAVCAYSVSSAISIDDVKWGAVPSGSAVSGGISGLSILGCQPGQGTQVFPPTSAEQETMCAAWCASPGCVDNNLPCTSNGDCCSNSCDQINNVCT